MTHTAHDRAAERANQLAQAQRGTLGLGRALGLAALIELIAALTRALAEPSATPVVLADLAAVGRALTAALCALAFTRIAPLGAAFSLGAHATSIAGLYALAALIPLLRFFDIVPPNLAEPVWDAVLIGTYGVTLLLTTLGALWTLRQLALARRRLMVAKRLAAASLPPLVLSPLVAVAVIPAVLPHPALAAVLAALSPWLLAFGHARRLRPAQAAGLSLGLGTALGLAVILGTPLLATGLSLAAAALVTAFGLISALHLLTDELSGRDAAGPSATFLRRLVAGTLGGESSRIGDLPRDSRLPGDESDDAASLALAYRELGIDPAAPRPAEIAPSAPGSFQNELPDDLVPFVPKSRREERPAPRAHDWTAARLGLRRLFAATLALTLLTAFSTLFSLTPLSDHPVALVIHGLAHVAIAALTVHGAHELSAHLPASLAPGPTKLLQLTAALALVATLALSLSPLLTPPLPAALPAALTILFSYFSLSLLLSRAAVALDDQRVASRARLTAALSAALALFFALRHFVLSLDASDLRWLAWPLGLVTMGLFVGLSLAMLWLLRDADTAAERVTPRPPR